MISHMLHPHVYSHLFLSLMILSTENDRFSPNCLNLVKEISLILNDIKKINLIVTFKIQHIHISSLFTSSKRNIDSRT